MPQISRIVSENRALDHLYDPVFTASNQRPLYRPTPPEKVDKATVTGAERYKFFKRPMRPFMQSVPPEVLLAPARYEPLLDAGPETERIAAASEPATKAVGSQSIYRESAAQTDPYTPDYYVRGEDGEVEPEILALTNLTYANGSLPAGLEEVEYIERARAKREFEASLPPATDVASFELRKKLLQEQELREWTE
eukprot:776056_1